VIAVRVTIDKDRCCGAAQCVIAAPEVFDQGEDGLVLLLAPTPPAESAARVREAADACPSRTIGVHES
jgi:ferredoxin